MKTGGVTGIFLPLRNVFSIDQYSFAFALGSFKVYQDKNSVHPFFEK